MKKFKVFLKTYDRWPVTFYDEDANQIQTADQVKDYLLNHNAINYSNPEKKNDKKKLMYKSQILTIIGPVDELNSNMITIDDVMSLSEAADRWGYKEASTIRNAIHNNKFLPNEHKKSDGTWFVTKQGMTRVYGPEVEHDYPTLIINEIYYDNDTGKFDIRKKI